MKISLDWLSDFVDLSGITPEEIAERLTLHTAEVDGYETVTVASGTTPVTDVLIEIDNKSLTNRPDLWGHYGMAREIAAIFGRPLKNYAVCSLDAYAGLPEYRVTIENFVDCPCYTAIAFDITGDGPSPDVVQRRLRALGTEPQSALIDITNYVQFELGQPTHAFDARMVGEISIGPAGAHRPFTTLDGRRWSLEPDDLLIYSDGEPAALAGIMGGHQTRIVADTKRVVLESANFRGSRVRITSQRLGLRTDSSMRFEKKLPPVFTAIASQRIFHLLREWGLAPEPVSRYTVAGDLKPGERSVVIAPGFLTRVSGTSIDNEEAKRILASIGFGCDARPDSSLDVRVPPFRSEYDISIPEDIGEEVMRLRGYAQIPPQLPVTTLRPAPVHAATHAQKRMRRVLSESHRFVETQSYGWFVDGWLETIGYAPNSPLILQNPIANDRGRMRDTILPNLLAVAAQTRKERDTLRIYEIGRVFRASADGKPIEHDELAGISIQSDGRIPPEQHLSFVRSALNDLARVNGLDPLVYTHEPGPDVPWIAEGLHVTVRSGEHVVGHCGFLPPLIRSKVVDRGQVAWFVVRTEPLTGEPFPAIQFRPLPLYPGSAQDFTFAWPVKRGYSELAKTLDAFELPMFERRLFVAYYRAPGTPDGKYSFRFFIRNPDRTVTAEDIDQFRAAIMVAISKSGLKLEE